MKIIFFGEDSFSALVLNSIIEDDFEVVLIVTPLYENHLFKRLEIIAGKYEIPFLRVKDIHSSEFIELIKHYNPDIIVTAHFKKLLKKVLIDIPKKGCVNLHPSLLPHYRGMAPQHWPIVNGDKETGITVHYINEGIDTGNILIQETLPILPDTYVYDLQMQMIPVYKRIMVEALRKIGNEDALGYIQDNTQGSFYGKLKKQDTEITKQSGAQHAYNLIRAFSRPYHGAYFDNYIIWKAHPAEHAQEAVLMKKYSEPGFYLDEENNALLRLHDGILKIDNFERI
jgi:methionyl-tRNA formyltransferase